MNALQVLTFVGETRVLVINASDELEEDELAGFDADTQTLFCGNVAGDQVVQVTRGGVRLAGAGGRGLLAEWRPPPGLQVTVASASTTQVRWQPALGQLFVFVWRGPVNAMNSQ